MGNCLISRSGSGIKYPYTSQILFDWTALTNSSKTITAEKNGYIMSGGCTIEVTHNGSTVSISGHGGHILFFRKGDTAKAIAGYNTSWFSVAYVDIE